MGIEKVTQKIIEDATREAKRIRVEYKKKSEEIIKTAEEEALRIKSESKEMARRESEALKRKILTQALLKIKKETLSEKRSILEQVFEKAKEEVLVDKDYPKLIRSLIKRYRENEGDEIILSHSDKKRFAESLKVKIANPRKMSGGVIVRSEKIEKNSSLDVTIQELKDELVIDLSRILFVD